MRERAAALRRAAAAAARLLAACQGPADRPSARLHTAPPTGRYLNDNSLTGSIPSAWASPGAFPRLSLLRVDSNRLAGPLPPELGRAEPGGANMPALTVL